MEPLRRAAPRPLGGNPDAVARDSNRDVGGRRTLRPPVAALLGAVVCAVGHHSRCANECVLVMCSQIQTSRRSMYVL